MKPTLLYALILVGALQLYSTNTKAQYVLIPDSSFAAALRYEIGSSCFIGNMMDTTCPAVLSLKSINLTLGPKKNFEGLQYFDSLEYLIYLGNSIDTMIIPAFPPRLIYCMLRDADIVSLPPLPLSIETLFLNSQILTTLPNLPDGLRTFSCRYSLITSIPKLPGKLQWLQLYDSEFLTNLPELPDSLDLLDVSGCIRLKCMPQLKTITDLKLPGGLSCLPNYGNVTTSTPALNTIPLCDYFNANGCQVFYNISGRVYVDEANDCIYNNYDDAAMGIKLQLYQSGNLIQTANTTPAGSYTLTSAIANYDYFIDTTDIPFTVTCPISGFYHSSFTSTDSTATGKDFALECNPGYDLVAQSLVTDEAFIPGRYTELFATGGDYTNFYGAHCAAGTGGSVVLTLDPLVTYVASAPGARQPTSVTATEVTWNIADFADVDFRNDFDVALETDSTAQAGAVVCLSLTVNPIAGDNNPANNTLSQCFEVQSSFDPNEKQVYPLNLIDTATKELTYTIHFQNTGNASARHIHIDDTLDNAIDRSSIKLVAYSHYPEMTVTDKALRFNFRNIFLPDSNTNEPGSKGYVQYRARLKNNLPVGTQIKNTAHIYFDYNPAIVTNTTVNTIVLSTGIPKPTAEIDFQLFPTPACNAVIVAIPENLIGGKLAVTDLLGRQAPTLFTLTGLKMELPVKDFANGIYFVTISKHDKSYTRKLVVNH